MPPGVRRLRRGHLMGPRLGDPGISELAEDVVRDPARPGAGPRRPGRHGLDMGQPIVTTDGKALQDSLSLTTRTHSASLIPATDSTRMDARACARDRCTKLFRNEDRLSVWQDE